MASFHYEMQDLPSPEAIQIANNISNLGQIIILFGFPESGLWPREISVGTEVFHQSKITSS